MIHELLNVGAVNARTTKELADVLGIDVRDVRQAVRNERMQGVPICSDISGYYLPADDNEMRRTVSRLYKIGRSNFAVAKALEEASKGAVDE